MNHIEEVFKNYSDLHKRRQLLLNRILSLRDVDTQALTDLVIETVSVLEQHDPPLLEIIALTKEVKKSKENNAEIRILLRSLKKLRRFHRKIGLYLSLIVKNLRASKKNSYLLKKVGVVLSNEHKFVEQTYNVLKEDERVKSRVLALLEEEDRRKLLRNMAIGSVAFLPAGKVVAFLIYQLEKALEKQLSSYWELEAIRR